MLLHKDMVSNGNFLFRWRGYVPAVMLLLSFLVVYTNGFDFALADTVMTKVAFAFILLGAAVRFYTIAYTPSGTSGRNTDKQVASTLNSTGIYSQCRNPLYLGNFFIYLGIVMYAQSWAVTLLFAALFWIYYERIISAEEDFLQVEFGEAYEAWANETPAFWPKMRDFKANAIPFTYMNVIYREKETIVFALISLLLINIFAHFVVLGEFGADDWLVGMTSLFAMAYAVVRYVGKTTDTFKVDGRD